MTRGEVYRAVKKAICQGVLVRPSICEKCGSAPGSASDGRSMIQAHHSDYSKPLDVEWICAKCHRKETRLPEVMGAPVFGELNGSSKLTEPQVLEIRASALSLRALGRIYGVDHKTIHRAKHGILWGHVSELADAPAAPAADAGPVEALGYQVLFDAIAAATSVYANGAVNISVQAFRDALSAHRAKGVA